MAAARGGPRGGGARGERGSGAVSELKPETETEGEAVKAEDLYGLKPELVDQVIAALDADDEARVRELAAPLRAADLADLLERLRPDQRLKLVRVLREDFHLDTLIELDPAVREELIAEWGVEDLAAAIAELDSDDAITLAEHLDEEERDELLRAVPPDLRLVLEEGLTFPEDSAGRLMQRELVAVPDYWTVGDTIDYLRETADLPDDFYDIFVVDPRHRPVGVIALNRLLRTKRPVVVRQITEPHMTVVPVKMDREEVAFLFRQHDLTSAPVVDAAGRLVGVITIDDVVDVIDEEAEEDIMRLGGVQESDIYEPALETTRGRATWLLVNLATAIVAANVVGLFQGTIARVVALAVLMPIVAGMGGNAGTQTLTVAVRALATKELTATNALRIVWKEVLVGGMNGILFALLIGLIAWFWFESVWIGAVIAAAMLINLTVAGLAGTLIPLTFARFGIDPAVASGVFLTTVTDVVGFLSFLGLATLVLL
ncbi:MAG: magnesium transporter [Proteobacteria bacterium]|nr:magnesium transporter [Pseudomonadota bacterium]